MRVAHVPANARVDRHLLVWLVILIVFGLAVLMSASAPVGIAKFNDTYYFFKRQILFGLIPGSIIFLIAAKLPLALLKRYAFVLYAGALALLVLVFIPGIGLTINGSRSWVHIANINFQPAEFAKLSLIVIIAYLLTYRAYKWDAWQESFVPVMATLAPALLLIVAQPDVGTLSIIAVIIFAMLFVAKVPHRYLLILFLLGVIAFGILVIIAPYRLGRLTTFLNPESDPMGVGYQINQSLVAVGSGGFWGLGFGHSRQKFQYLPEVSADSIYAVIAEENGFIVAVALVVLIMLIGWRGLRIAKRAPDEFSKLLVAGIVVWLVWQSFLNIGATVGVLPLTGVPLPFISHGGSALIAALAGVGLMLNVSKHVTLN